MNLLEYERELWSAGYNYIAGVDEVGRGCIAGPVVAAAVIFSPGQKILGINDSKQLSSVKRESFHKVIIKHCLSYRVWATSAKNIDRTNILKASLHSMREALLHLSQIPDYVLIDGNRVPDDLPFPSQYIIRGDSKGQTIAAASIVAKVTRDKLMVKLGSIYPEYGFAAHKGYGTALHIKKLMENGPTAHHRFSFKPIREPRLKFK